MFISSFGLINFEKYDEILKVIKGLIIFPSVLAPQFLSICQLCIRYDISYKSYKLLIEFLEDIKNQLPSYQKQRPFSPKEVRIIIKYLEGE